MANKLSEQITKDLNIEVAKDMPFNSSQITNLVTNILGNNNCFIEEINKRKVLCYKHDDKIIVLLKAAITYLGGSGQHPIFKKRVQLKHWYKEIVNYYKDKVNYDVRFIGVYHYKDNIIFTDFIKDTYINKKMNNSAAHVYINDLYQAMKNGLFKKTDRNKNKLITIRKDLFKKYLDGDLDNLGYDLFKIFEEFNKSSFLGKWITAKEAITEMHEAKWHTWKETEWAGWYLEFKMDQFIKKNNFNSVLTYIGGSNKKKGDLDFDLWFSKDNFFGDLKANSKVTKDSLGNDQENFINSITKYNKFWYVVYEHDTIKDEKFNYEATKFRTNFIKDKGEWPKNKEFDELSYHRRMKHSVKFEKMNIIELNNVNFREVLKDFNQGRQPNGDKRKKKFKISKKNMDNYVVYHEEFNKE